jgi:hypothetical protein
MAAELRRSIDRGTFIYEAKLFLGRVMQLTASVPVKKDGSFDLDQQKPIAAATRRFDLVRSKLHELGDWSEGARIS